MVIPASVTTFLEAAPSLALGYNSINFFAADALEEAQTGYCIAANGSPLATGNIGDWQSDWLVIADDSLGDPIFTDTSFTNLPVLSAAHGEGIWEPFVIADSLENFKKIIVLIAEVTKGRDNAETLEQNPISQEEQDAVLKAIEQQNPGAEVWYWENFFENDF